MPFVSLTPSMAELLSVQESFERGNPAIGTTLKSVSPNVVEALGNTPLDFVLVDRQHGSPVYESLEHIVRAADLNSLPVIVRIPKDDLRMITFCLDIGVAGIMLPQIDDPTTVVDAGIHTRFSAGRSIATTSRAADFGARDREEYIDFVDEEIALLPQLESREGVAQAGTIAGLEETTSLAIGPGDLSRSLGESRSSPKVEEAIDEVFAEANREGCGAGIFVGSPADIERYREKASYIIYNSDVGLLMNHFEEVLG